MHAPKSFQGDFMKTNCHFAAIAVASVLAAGAVWAATNEPATLVDPKPINRNHLVLSYRLGLNITADFRRLGGFPALTDPGPDTGATENRNYDNGYNRVDVTGNNHQPGFPDTTWYWGFQGGDAVQGNSIVLRSASSPANAVSRNNDDGVNHGFELAYQRELKRAEKWRGGLEAAFGFTTLAISDARELRNEVNLITDTFPVPGGVEVIPGYPFGPNDGYAGSYNGPGPLLDSSLDPGQRVRSVVTQAATITGRRELDADLYLFRLGPYVEFPLTEKLSLFLNGGLNLAVGATRFSFTETVAYDNGIRASRRDAGSQTDVLVGGYAGGGLAYALNEQWSVLAGAQFQTAGRSINEQGGKQSVLDMGATIVVTLGVGFSF
jgi:hypothetical protein